MAEQPNSQGCRRQYADCSVEQDQNLVEYVERQQPDRQPAHYDEPKQPADRPKIQPASPGDEVMANWNRCWIAASHCICDFWGLCYQARINRRLPRKNFGKYCFRYSDAIIYLG
jgi:hypothetical protein